jgi:hypothetical protein
MLIESEHKIEVEKKIPMEITLAEDTSIAFIGRAASCLEVRDTDPKRYDIGIEFIKMSEKDSEDLEEFIELLDVVHKSPS